jgi:hypothetical protein
MRFFGRLRSLRRCPERSEGMTEKAGSDAVLSRSPKFMRRVSEGMTLSVTLRALARRVSYCRDSSLTLRMTERRVRMAEKRRVRMTFCVTLFLLVTLFLVVTLRALARRVSSFFRHSEGSHPFVSP